MPLQFTVSDPVEREIRSLRRECAKLRVQRNDARAEVDALRAELRAQTDGE